MTVCNVFPDPEYYKYSPLSIHYGDILVTADKVLDKVVRLGIIVTTTTQLQYTLNLTYQRYLCFTNNDFAPPMI